jgi:putative nucleotidyltransferase with HDIG domain
MSTQPIGCDLDDLPSPPAVVMELLNSIDQEDIDVSVLATKVSADLALTAKTVRLANSSLYGISIKVTTIQQAITYLGFEATRNFPSRQCAGFDTKAFWRHAIAVGACARMLARHLHLSQDVAFTAGLLHDIGRLVLVTLHPQQYAQVIAYRKEHDCTLLAAETAVMGVDHVVAGLALARQWQFSDMMRQSIAFHHAPETPGAGFLATIVHVADGVVHALDLTGQEDELVPPLSSVAWTALGLDEEVWLQVFRETELQFEEMATILMA